VVEISDVFRQEPTSVDMAVELSKQGRRVAADNFQ
jgi:hypothetical protein